jgi:3-deoxy-7-phosphoheptulonate synthase
MIFRLASNADERSTTELLAQLRQGGLSLYPIIREGVQWFATSAPDPGSRELLQRSPLVASWFETPAGYQLTSRSFQPANTIVSFGDLSFGDGSVQVIAGPCAVESSDLAFRMAGILQKEGLVFFRGGLFKPRTSPYSFQGLGERGIPILRELKERFGLRIVVEVLDERSLELLEPVADLMQVGSRNMQNFALLKILGGARKPILLKRGMAATIEELLLAAEYIAVHGNPRIILCERGIRTAATHSRNTLDLSVIPILKQETHLPVIVDPSHGTGRDNLVRPMARAAIAAGADGVMVEVHPEPARALSDGYQSITPNELHLLVDDLQRISTAMGTNLGKKTVTP